MNGPFSKDSDRTSVGQPISVRVWRRYRGGAIGSRRRGIVYGTSRTTEKLAKAKALGIEETITVNELPEQFVQAIEQLTNGAGVNVILDLVGGDYFPANLRAVAPRARIICVGTTAGRKSEIDLGHVLRKRATIIGTVLRARSTAGEGGNDPPLCRPRPATRGPWSR